MTLRSDKVEAEEAGREYLALEHIEPSTGRRLDDDSVTSEGIATLFEAGDVLFSKLRPYLAKVYAADKRGMATTELLVMVAEPVVLPSFLKFLLLSGKFIDAVAGATYGAKMPRANWDMIGGVPVALPSLAEQAHIAEFLGWKTRQIDALGAKKQTLIESLGEERLAVITATVTRGLLISNVSQPAHHVSQCLSTVRGREHGAHHGQQPNPVSARHVLASVLETIWH